MKLKFLFPFLVFVGLLVFLAVGLTRDPSQVPSPLINKPAPVFELPVLSPSAVPAASFVSSSMKGQVWMLNVWASWCSGCLEEHPFLMRLSQESGVVLIGLNYKDQRDKALQFLEQKGNPYHQVAFDAKGKVGIDYGVYGVPETFVIDAQGVIRYKHIGAIDQHAWKQKIEPLIIQLKKAS